jgi:hypothetical protein
MVQSEYQFTNNWFLSTAKPTWDVIVPRLRPQRALEVGSYEGASACYLIEQVGAYQDLEIVCVDTWDGGVGRKDRGIDYSQMGQVFQRFQANTQLAINKAKHRIDLSIAQGLSDIELPRLIADGKSEYFDLIYIDGSHQAPDVLSDAVQGFKLLKIEGVMIFDDYLWQERLTGGVDLVRCPKPAIDAFVNIFCRKVRVLNVPLAQFCVQKITS